MFEQHILKVIFKESLQRVSRRNYFECFVIFNASQTLSRHGKEFYFWLKIPGLTLELLLTVNVFCRNICLSNLAAQNENEVQSNLDNLTKAKVSNYPGLSDYLGLFRNGRHPESPLHSKKLISQCRIIQISLAKQTVTVPP